MITIAISLNIFNINYMSVYIKHLYNIDKSPINRMCILYQKEEARET